MGGGHNNSGNSVGVQQKSSMMDKLKNVFSSKKEVDQRVGSESRIPASTSVSFPADMECCPRCEYGI